MDKLPRQGIISMEFDFSIYQVRLGVKIKYGKASVFPDFIPVPVSQLLMWLFVWLFYS